ncbi:MAG TPA: ABA4-like family protein, partial [Gemmataceae bacterium]|nr:ABA4-like family protein [Gemmataceae bacterium]
MTPSDSLFQFVTLLPLPFWFLMIVLPRWRGTQKVMRGRLAVMPLLAAYAVLAVPQLAVIVPVFFRVEPVKLDDLAGLLARPEIALVAWIHFLAFDLFVGRWIYRDGREREISAWPMAAVLTLTLLLGPLGLLL